MRLKSALLAFTALTMVVGPALAQTSATRTYEPVTNDMLLNPPAEEWLNWRGTVDNQGYSPLDQINKENVAQLQLAWAWPMAEQGQQEVAPLIHDGIMFLATNNNIVQALDAKTGEMLWEYRHVRPEFPATSGYHNNQARRQKNSIALYEGAVILTTVDAKIVSLDALTGQVNWETQVHDWEKGYSYTAGPLVADGKIFAGVSGCSIAGTNGGCYFTAHDAETGEELWRFNTIADPNNPEVDASWNGVPVENRWGGSPWVTGSYDAETKTVYFGTGMPIPYPEVIRGSGDGDVLYTNTTLALDAETGERKWHYQVVPRDNWDLDSPFERVLVELDGEKLLISVPSKTGIAFANDAETGEYLWSKETIYQNVITGISETGEITLNQDLIPTEVGQQVDACPSFSGGKLWQAGAYSPLTQRFYVPLAESCNTVSPQVQEFTPGNAVGSVRVGPRTMPPGVEEAGVISAIDVANAGNEAWRHTQRATLTSSLLATGGGLVFGGDAGRYLKALDQDTGDVLWEVRLNAPIGGHPATYEIDGEQYLVIPTGFSAQAASSASLFSEIPVPSGSGNSIFVFKLPQAETTAAAN